MDNKLVNGSAAQLSESGFLSKVYLWMSLGLAVSGVASTALMMSPSLLKTILSSGLIMIGLIIAEFGLVIWMSAAYQKMSASTMTTSYMAYSVLSGVTLTPVFLYYTSASIATTFMVTAGTFVFFAIYGATTKKDLTGLGSLLFVGLLGVVVGSLINLFLKNSMMDLIITFVSIAVFMGLIAYKSQQLKMIYQMGFENEDSQKKAAVMGAFTLYLSFMNLFLQLLRIFGKRRD